MAIKLTSVKVTKSEIPILDIENPFPKWAKKTKAELEKLKLKNDYEGVIKLGGDKLFEFWKMMTPGHIHTSGQVLIERYGDLIFKQMQPAYRDKLSTDGIIHSYIIWAQRQLYLVLNSKMKVHKMDKPITDFEIWLAVYYISTWSKVKGVHVRDILDDFIEEHRLNKPNNRHMATVFNNKKRTENRNLFIHYLRLNTYLQPYTEALKQFAAEAKFRKPEIHK